MKAYLKQAFPNLETEGFDETSPASATYNCIAWAVGQQTAWWWPYQHPAYYWPQGQPREVTLHAFIHAFESLGYQECENGDLEANFENVAIYAADGKPTHAARQMLDGRWTSKLGRDIDIAHSLPGLEGPAYGQIAAYLKRPSSSALVDAPVR
jgi:hypothetical protein